MTSVRTRSAIWAAGGALIAALTVGTAIASADAADDAFAADVGKLGISGSPAALRDLGQLICADLGRGTSPDTIAQEFEQNGPALVAAAKKAYCP
jgi:hypothetical protein